MTKHKIHIAVIATTQTVELVKCKVSPWWANEYHNGYREEGALRQTGYTTWAYVWLPLKAAESVLESVIKEFGKGHLIETVDDLQQAMLSDGTHLYRVGGGFVEYHDVHGQPPQEVGLDDPDPNNIPDGGPSPEDDPNFEGYPGNYARRI